MTAPGTAMDAPEPSLRARLDAHTRRIADDVKASRDVITQGPHTTHVAASRRTHDPRDRELTVTVPNRAMVGAHDVLTPDAVASMVGQSPRVLHGQDWTQPLGSATVTAATLDANGDIHMTLALNVAAYDALRVAAADQPLTTWGGDWSAGIGYQRPAEDDVVVLREVSPAPPAYQPRHRADRADRTEEPRP